MSDIPPLSPEMLVPRLGDALVEKGLITELDLQRVLAEQANLDKTGRRVRIGQLLVDLGFVERSSLEAVVAEQILKLRTALQDANAQLEQRVIERTAQLQAALTKLSELSKLKSNFVANISHELRTPLTHLKGYLDLLSNGDLADVEDQKRALATMQRSADRLGRLIEDLILFSVVDRGDATLKITPLNIASIGLAVVNRNLTKAFEKSIKMDMNIPFTSIMVEADADKISWVLMQLVDNALKFTPQNGKINLEIVPEGEFTRISVSDTGIGIPPEKVEEMFEPFHQLDGSSTRKYAGTGLGLTLVRKIVEAHGSIISVKSTPGQGSCFEFLLQSSKNPSVVQDDWDRTQV